MGLQLGSQELVDEIMKRQAEDPEFKKIFTGLNISILFVATDCPGNEDRQYTISIQDGRFATVDVVKEPAPSELRDPSFDEEKFDFKAIGDHDSFFKLLKGKIDLIEWIQRVRLVGDFGKPMTQLAGLTGFLNVLSTMDLEP